MSEGARLSLAMAQDAARALVNLWRMPADASMVVGSVRRGRDEVGDLEFVARMPVDRVAMENPVGIISTRIRKSDQRIQPYEFGDDASKNTCLWLNKLPPLIKDPAKRFQGRWVEHPPGSGKMVERWSNQTDSGQNRLGPSEGRWKERSRTYAGIARAMAEQWTNRTQPVQHVLAI